MKKGDVLYLETAREKTPYSYTDQAERQRVDYCIHAEIKVGDLFGQLVE